MTQCDNVKESIGAQRPIIICDDDDLMHLALRQQFGKIWRLAFAKHGSEVYKFLSQQPNAVVLLDLHLGVVETGMSVLVQIRRRFPAASVIVWSGREDYASIVEAMRHGAVDYVPKGASMPPLRRSLEKWARLVLDREKAKFTQSVFPENSAAAKECMQKMRRFRSLNTHVLITGEAGAGKSLLAKYLHNGKGPLIEAAACALEVKVAHSRVNDTSYGAPLELDTCWKQAAGGSLVIEEVADLHPRVQSRLSQLLDMQTDALAFSGTDQGQKQYVRILGTTRHPTSSELVGQGISRALIDRISVLVLAVPPLRDRSADVRMLVDNFIGYIQPQRSNLEENMIKFLADQQWPGNVRQLANCLQFGLAVAGDDQLHPSCLEEFFSYSDPVSKTPGNERHDGPKASAQIAGGYRPTDSKNSSQKFREKLKSVEQSILREEYENSNFCISTMAQRSGFSRTYLYEKLRKLGILGGRGHSRRDSK